MKASRALALLLGSSLTIATGSAAADVASDPCVGDLENAPCTTLTGESGVCKPSRVGVGMTCVPASQSGGGANASVSSSSASSTSSTSSTSSASSTSGGGAGGEGGAPEGNGGSGGGIPKAGPPAAEPDAGSCAVGLRRAGGSSALALVGLLGAAAAFLAVGRRRLRPSSRRDA